MKNVKKRLKTPLRGRSMRVINVGIDPVLIHLVVTRQTGDKETYKLGEVPNLMCAIEYRRRLAGIKLPRVLRMARSRKVKVA